MSTKKLCEEFPAYSLVLLRLAKLTLGKMILLAFFPSAEQKNKKYRANPVWFAVWPEPTHVGVTIHSNRAFGHTARCQQQWECLPVFKH